MVNVQVRHFILKVDQRSLAILKQLQLFTQRALSVRCPLATCIIASGATGKQLIIDLILCHPSPCPREDGECGRKAQRIRPRVHFATVSRSPGWSVGAITDGKVQV